MRRWPVTRDEAVQLLATREAAFRQGDAEGLAAVYGDDAVLISPMFGTVTGRAAIQRTHQKLFEVFKDMVIDTAEPIVESNRAAQSWTGHATHTTELFGVPPSGRRFEIHGVFIFEFRDGKIAHERRLYDFTGLLLQLGVLKARPN
jgi:steroid delta-isomerase-like uncharacterized protein